MQQHPIKPAADCSICPEGTQTRQTNGAQAGRAAAGL